MKKQQALGVLLAAALPVAALAQQSGIEDVLVTGTYAPQSDLTASTTVYDEDYLQGLNKRTLAQLLQTVPGLLVEQQGGPGGLTAVSIRGAESNFTLVLLDGVAVNDPTNVRGGSFDFGNLQSSLVQRIEIVRGAQSAVYGSDALAGVINIVTRKPQDGHSQQARAEWGEDDFAHYAFAASGASGNLDYTVELATRDDGEPVEGSTRDTDSARLMLGWEPDERNALRLGYRYLDGERTSYPEQSGGARYALSSELDEAEYRNDVYSLDWRLRFSDVWTSLLSANRFEHDEIYYSPGIVPYFAVPPNFADTEFRRDQLRWVNTLSVAEGVTVNLGADYRDEEGDSAGYLEFFDTRLPTNYALDRSTKGYFGDVSYRAVPGLLLQGSVRYDDPDGFDSETSFSAGARYALSEALSVSANWGEAFKLPSFFALGHPLVGNPELRPEKADNWDLGLAWRAGDTLSLELTWFENDYEDLVDFDDESFRNVNRKNIETSGAELSGNWQASDALALRAFATYTDIDVKGEDTVLTGRPEWVAGATADWRFAPQWRTTLDYHYSGEQWAASRHTGEEVTEELDAYHRLDWVLSWQLRPALSLSLSADNLLDEDYETAVGFDAPGRALRVGFRLSH